MKYKNPTFGSLLTKNIKKNIESELISNKEMQIKANMIFYKFGMVDTHFGPKGNTFLHYLIKAHSSDLIQYYFDNQNDSLIYQPNFEGITPI